MTLLVSMSDDIHAWNFILEHQQEIENNHERFLHKQTLNCKKSHSNHQVSMVESLMHIHEH